MIKIPPMLKSICLLAVAFIPMCAATSTFNINAFRLDDANNNPMPSTGLVILAASFTDDLFADPTADAFFPDPDDIELGRWTIGNSDGDFEDSYVFTYDKGEAPGDALQLYWFPTLLETAMAPGFNTPYGTYRSDVKEVDGQDYYAWRVPSDNIVGSLAFFTAEGGSLVNSAESGDARFATPVPEPSFYAGAFALGCLAWAAASKKWRRGKLA
jgi:hypothetical protein